MTQDKIWAYFQNEGVASFEQALPRYRFLLRRISKRLTASASTLNIGVGSGMLERMLVEKGCRVAALDPDESTIQRIKDLGVDARVGMAEKLPFDNARFDVVVASEVLEHLSPDRCREALLEICRTLKPGGLFLGTVPYREHLADNLVVCPDCEHRFHRWGHQQSFDKQTLTDLLSQNFDVLFLSRRSFVPWSLSPIRTLKSAVKWLLGRAGEAIASPHFYFECRKPLR